MGEKIEQKRVPGFKEKGQKYKSLLVMQYLLKHADDEHPVTIGEIEAHLSKYGISAERRSIYRDIRDMMELLNTELDDDGEISERDKLQYEVTFTRKKYPNADQGGYLITARPYEFDELRLLAECVNSARFLSESQAKTVKELLADEEKTKAILKTAFRTIYT